MIEPRPCHQHFPVKPKSWQVTDLVACGADLRFDHDRRSGAFGSGRGQRHRRCSTRMVDHGSICVDYGVFTSRPVRVQSRKCACSVLPVEGIGLDVIQAPNRGLESCGMNSRTLNGRPSLRSPALLGLSNRLQRIGFEP